MARRKQSWSPSADDLRQVLDEQNPWHATGSVPPALAFEVERPLARYLWKRITDNRPRRFQLILGPRRVGKSTCMFQTVRHLLQDAKVPREGVIWLRMDHPILMRHDLGNLLRHLLKSRPTAGELTYVFLDELNYAKEWDLWLKTFYDENWPVQIVASSSSAAALRNRIVESGVGRWEEQFLPPYLFSEYLNLVRFPIETAASPSLYTTVEACAAASLDLEELAKHRQRYLLIGGFPELLLEGNSIAEGDEEGTILRSQKVLRGDAVQSAIYKDIPQAFGVDNPMLLERLLYTLGGQAGNILSPSTICQTLDGMSAPTFDRYLSYLERAYLVFSLPNYSGREGAVQKRGRKLYFVDSAVRNAALQRGVLPLRNPAEMGMLVENLVAGHIHSLSQQTQVRLYHWRDKDSEVDLIFDHPDEPLALEIATSNHARKGLESFAGRFPRYFGRCYLVSAKVTRTRLPEAETSDAVGTYPLDLFLLAVSQQTEKALETNLFSPAGPA